jgi:hypothetical protein
LRAENSYMYVHFITTLAPLHLPPLQLLCSYSWKTKPTKRVIKTSLLSLFLYAVPHGRSVSQSVTHYRWGNLINHFQFGPKLKISSVINSNPSTYKSWHFLYVGFNWQSLTVRAVCQKIRWTIILALNIVTYTNKS